ncbi:SAVED domain-containing protein [Deinococcus sp. QL22]|uniref:SAVED domain-containing protein n=1 Tax=Deinococcus sp. QL22 TaxID=2939437 RepID=UPI00201810E0|nr:SAVED domain-containing protein [Deinococcus sp. QL22]UQN10198.1 SAVED domain-containing protein [Deinococcus sp. QL22]
MSHDPSFQSKAHQGGIGGSRGFTAQTIVLLHRLPKLFDDPLFESAVLEGQEDFDLHFKRPEGKRLHVVQCKATSLDKYEVRKILDGMYQRYLSDPRLYEGFELVAQAFPPKVEAVRQGAHTAAQVRKGYAGTATDRSTAPDFTAQVDAMLTELKCTSGISVDWVMEYLSFSTRIPSYPFDEQDVIDRFASQCTDCQQFGVQILAPFRYAAAQLHQKFALRLRDPLTRQELAQIVHDACQAYKDQVQQNGVKIHVDHWRDPDGAAIGEADHVFEWRDHYDAAGRGNVPPAGVTAQLLRELQEFETRNMTVWKNAEVQFLPPCSISAAFVVGYTFRRTKGYKLSMPALTENWSFDPDMSQADDIHLKVTGEELGQDARSAVVALGVGRNITVAVRGHAEAHGLTGKFVAYRTSVDQLNEHQARKVANDFISALRDLDSAGVAEIHLFYAGPIALAAMVGSLMNKIGRVSLYEADDQRTYHLAFTLNT